MPVARATAVGRTKVVLGQQVGPRVEFQVAYEANDIGMAEMRSHVKWTPALRVFQVHVRAEVSQKPAKVIRGPPRLLSSAEP